MTWWDGNWGLGGDCVTKGGEREGVCLMSGGYSAWVWVSRAGQGRRRISWVMKKKRSIKNGNNNLDEYSCVLCRH